MTNAHLQRIYYVPGIVFNLAYTDHVISSLQQYEITL